MSRIGNRGAAWALTAALASSCHHAVTAERRPLGEAATRSLAPSGTTFTVQLVDPIDSNLPKGPLDAVVLGPILATDGSMLVSSGAVVAGSATGVPGPNGSSLRLELDSIDTIHGKTTLFATLAPHQRDPSFAATDVQGPGVGYDALLGQPPDALPEPEPATRPTSGPSIRLHAGARLDLMLTRPLAPARRDPSN